MQIINTWSTIVAVLFFANFSEVLGRCSINERCQNGGRCLWGECQCDDGYFGTHCEHIVECPTPGEEGFTSVLGLNNASYLYDIRDYNVSYGGMLSCECLPGFLSEAPCQIRCESNGQWALTTSCEAVDCGAPPEVENGTAVISGGTTFDNTVWYDCAKGYVSFENYSLICGQNGTWRSHEGNGKPMCVPSYDCGSPPEITLGKVTFWRTKPNSEASYSCDVGYRLKGTPTSICRKMGFRKYGNRTIAKWIFVPRCVPDCTPKDMSDSVIQQTFARLEITSCVSETGKEECNKSLSLFLQNGDNQLHPNYILTGSEICIGYLYREARSVHLPRALGQRKPYLEHISSEESCRSFCMPHVDSYKMVVSEENQIHDEVEGKYLIRRLIMKYAATSFNKEDFADSLIGI